MKFGIVVFPGTNCDLDCKWAIEYLGYSAEFVWHKDTDLSNLDCLVLAGGFSYGDYLRTGAIARFSPVMNSIKKYIDDGGLVLGICNGFQILLEAELLPGAMLPNKELKFICKSVYLKVENERTPFTNLMEKSQVAKIPINHYEGNYFADDSTLEEMNYNRQIAFRYCNKSGDISARYCPNGSIQNIAGITNKSKNVLGLMPHPERASEKIMGSTDGALMFRSAANFLAEINT